jgi:hypothetical protein
MGNESLSDFFGQPNLGQGSAPDTDVPADDSPEQGQDADYAGDDEPAEANNSVPYSRYEEANAKVKALEARNDELFRALLSNRPAAPQEEEVEVDPDVARQVNPLLDRRLKGVEAMMARQEMADKMSRVEELSPGISKMWDKIQEEFQALPGHLQAEFDTMGGAIALRQKIDARTPRPSKTAADALKRRAHTEAGPGTRTGGSRQPNDQDIERMTSAQFEAYLASVQENQRRPAGSGKLIR